MKVSDMDIEKEIVAKGKTAARVTPEHIESVIREEYYFTADQAVSPALPDAVTILIEGLKNLPGGDEYLRMWDEARGDLGAQSPKHLQVLTFCVLMLENGFTVTGESACASPENFDPEIGRKIARENAVNKIWPLEGYLLKQRLYEEK